MRKVVVYLGILLGCFFSACSGNDDVKTIEQWEDEYVLPQGKSDADDRIVEYYNRYGTYILYEYTDLDFRYELGNTYVHELPDPTYVGDMLDFLEDIWFDFYPADFHKKFMPLKIMLADYIASEDIWTGTMIPTFYATGSACIGFGFCSDTLQKISPATKLEFTRNLHEMFWFKWGEMIEIPEEFFEVSDYSHAAVTDPASDDYTRKRGFVTYSGSEWSLSVNYLTQMLDEQTDFWSYLIGFVTRSSADWEEDLQWPLVKQKYDILRNHLQGTYGFDIQKVGDATYE